MIEPDFIFTDGFDKYVQTRGTAFGVSDAYGHLIRGEWTDWGGSGLGDLYFTNGLAAGGGTGSSPGSGLRMDAQDIGASSPLAHLYKTLPGTYKRSIGGVTLLTDIVGAVGVSFKVGATYGLSIIIEAVTGRIQLRRGAWNGVIIASSAESVSAGSINCIQWDITMKAAATGSYKIWLNGVLTSLDATLVDTSAIATDGFDAFALVNGAAAGRSDATFDHLHLWCYTAEGQVGLAPPLDNPIIETQFPINDYVASFTVGPSIIGTDSRTIATSAAVGANLYLRPFTVEENCTLGSIKILPATTSAVAKYKALVYADDGSGGVGVAGSPGVFLDAGTEVVGSTSGTTLNLPLTTPQALLKDQIIWLGWYGDTNISAFHEITGTTGIRKAVTYATAPQDPLTGETTLQPVFHLYGVTSLTAERWAQVNQPSPSSQSYNADTAIGAKDMFVFAPLSVTPTAIHGIAVKAACLRTDAGARTINLPTLSGAIQSAGNKTGIAPPLTLSYAASYFWFDPATGSEWTPAGVNNAFSGYEIVT